MPQMMPMNWIMMFVSLNIIILIMMIILNHNNIIQPNKMLYKYSTYSNKWMW